jgi:putative inorganic carbon (HCO3(-)) transporter
MQHFIFKLGEEGYKHPRSKTLRQWVKNQVVLDKLDTPLGYMVLSLVSMALAFWVATSSLPVAWLILLNVVLLPCLLGAMLNQRFGITLLLLGAFFIELFQRYTPEVPLSIYMDALVLVMLFGILVRQTRERNWRFLVNPISGVLLLWLGYNLLQLWNPILPSARGWLEVFRLTGVFLLLFYVGLYAWTTRQQILQFLYLWITLVSLAAIYGLYQAWMGLPEFDQSWLMDNRDRFQEFYTLHGLRVFSVFRDPSAFGITLAYTALMSLILLLRKTTPGKLRIVLGLATGLMLLAMFYTNTRSAYLILTAGFFFFALLSMERHILIAAAALLVLVLALMFIPTDHNRLRNIQGAFWPTRSYSYQAQMENLEYVQPYIRRHALGAGMGTTGSIGQRYAPFQMYSQYPAESGYIRTALEMGWVGLALLLFLLGSILWVGVRRYFRTRDQASRSLYQALLTLLLVLVLANYPDQVIMQFPTNVLFVGGMVAIVKLKGFSAQAAPQA